MTDTANAPERLVVIWTIADEDTMPATVSAHTPKSRDFERGAPRWMEGKRLEYVLSTHCDELVAAARAEGAREAQAKIARLTEALNEKQDDGKNFWMNWTQKRLEINRAMFLRDAKLALAGDMRALRNRVELMEAEPVPIVLSSALQENANG